MGAVTISMKFGTGMSLGFDELGIHDVDDDLPKRDIRRVQKLHDKYIAKLEAVKAAFHEELEALGYESAMGIIIKLEKEI